MKSIEIAATGFSTMLECILRIDNTGAGRFSVFCGLLSNYKS